MSFTNQDLMQIPKEVNMMMPTMAKEKKPAHAQKPEPISYRPKPDVAKALKEFRDRLPVDPGNSKIIDQALREFLRGQGLDVPEKPDADE